MNSNLNLMFGKRSFSISFLDKEMEEDMKNYIHFFKTSSKQAHVYRIGVQDNSNFSEDFKAIDILGNRLYCNNTKKGETQVLFPKKESLFTSMDILAFFSSEFYRLGSVNGIKDNIFLIHAAGLQKTGKGFLFTGSSGAGKTTVSKLSLPEAEIISDELIVVDEDHDGYWISQGAKRSEIAKASDKTAKLCAIFILIQDKTNSLTQLKGSNIGIKLMSNIVYVKTSGGSNWENILTEKLRIISKITEHIPVYELRFTKDKKFWREIETLDCI